MARRGFHSSEGWGPRVGSAGWRSPKGWAPQRVWEWWDLPGLYTTVRELKSCTIEGSGVSNTNTTNISREPPEEREERMKIVAGEGKKRNFFCSPPFRASPSGPPSAKHKKWIGQRRSQPARKVVDQQGQDFVCGLCKKTSGNQTMPQQSRKLLGNDHCTHY